jgi:hypothetical protein
MEGDQSGAGEWTSALRAAVAAETGARTQGLAAMERRVGAVEETVGGTSDSLAQAIAEARVTRILYCI